MAFGALIPFELEFSSDRLCGQKETGDKLEKSLNKDEN